MRKPFLRRCRVWLSSARRDIIRGLHYDIPVCCIFYWLTLRHFGAWGFRDHPYLKRKRAVIPRGVGYVQCNRCYRKEMSRGIY